MYKFTCSRYKACYVGFTRRHLKTHADEHRAKKSQPIAKRYTECKPLSFASDFVSEEFNDETAMIGGFP